MTRRFLCARLTFCTVFLSVCPILRGWGDGCVGFSEILGGWVFNSPPNPLPPWCSIFWGWWVGTKGAGTQPPTHHPAWHPCHAREGTHKTYTRGAVGRVGHMMHSPQRGLREGTDRWKVVMCPRQGRDPASRLGPKSRRWGGFPYHRNGVPTWTHLANERWQLPSFVWTRQRAGKRGQSGGSVGTTYQGKGRVNGKVGIGQAPRGRAQGGKRLMGAATYGGTGQGKGSIKWREANRRRQLQTAIQPCVMPPPWFGPQSSPLTKALGTNTFLGWSVEFAAAFFGNLWDLLCHCKADPPPPLYLSEFWCGAGNLLTKPTTVHVRSPTQRIPCTL